MIRNDLLFGVLFGFLMLLVTSQVFAQADVIEQRQKLMKSNGESTKAIKAAADAKDYRNKGQRYHSERRQGSRHFPQGGDARQNQSQT